MTDIVERLRALFDGKRWPMMDEAADEIERLREHAAEAAAEIQALQDEIEQLRGQIRSGQP